MNSTRALDLMHGGFGGAVVAGGAAVIVMVFVRGLGGAALSPIMMIVAIVGAAGIGGLVQRAMVSAGGTVAGQVVQPKGDTTPYVTTFSHIETLEIRGDIQGAMVAWADACAQHPGNALARVKAADFHLRQRKDAKMALPLYREARDLPTASSELVRYAQAKIIDLYLGPLKDEGRALVEMRRLIERFPGTKEADEARAALARIKSERTKD